LPFTSLLSSPPVHLSWILWPSFYLLDPPNHSGLHADAFPATAKSQGLFRAQLCTSFDLIMAATVKHNSMQDPVLLAGKLHEMQEVRCRFQQLRCRKLNAG
jgi:hypothetical protein